MFACCSACAVWSDVYADHLDLHHPLARTVPNVLTESECAAYIARIRSGDAEVAPITQGIDLAVRNNTRVMWDDAAEADGLLERVKAFVPKRFRDEELACANPRLRLYRYQVGEKHGLHFDTVVELPGMRSRMTMVFYLNDDFEGGATDFPELPLRVVPQRGSALLFQHRVLHEAMPVTRGEKFVLRTDLFFRSA